MNKWKFQFRMNMNNNLAVETKNKFTNAAEHRDSSGKSFSSTSSKIVCDIFASIMARAVVKVSWKRLFTNVDCFLHMFFLVKDILSLWTPTEGPMGPGVIDHASYDIYYTTISFKHFLNKI